MEARTLDQSKSYGTVTGHEVAKFAQNDLLFDAEGKEVIEKKDVHTVNKPSAKAAPAGEFEGFDRVEASAFLLKHLGSGDTVAVKDLKREAENVEVRWDVVKSVFTEKKGKELKRKNVPHWKLPPS